ncbi:uncharacterized protein E0L32_003151 [Thyridium curvatum]|uniref:Alcohol acetyltransferase n=1 Tax=Thyridium curvatum TaxID=1093900 RepID=A0A507BLF6_9PEZI|nr:uncharacterized protein E0L32_003151 [Thyridium curvatum]TPX17508.1 hypothetical protein E0L32_003151 [Thyridium curvatum]
MSASTGDSGLRGGSSKPQCYAGITADLDLEPVLLLRLSLPRPEWMDMDKKTETSYHDLRPLGPLEQYSVTRSQLGIYLNVCLTAFISRQTAGHLKPRLCRALAALILRHPVLSAVPVDLDSQPSRFVRLPTIDLDTVVTVRDVAEDEEFSLDTALEAQHNEPFVHRPGELIPFWRVLAFENGADIALTLCFHHSLFDGKSAVVFLEDLGVLLSDPSEHTSLAEGVIPTPIYAPLPPALESILELPLSNAFVAKQKEEPEVEAHVWSARAQSLPVRTRFSSLHLSSRASKTIVNQSKQHGVSVTATLMSCLASSIFAAIPEEYSTIQGDCAVSLRPFLGPHVTERDMGCWVAAFSETYHRYPCSEDLLWENAQRTKATIDKVMRNKGKDTGTGYLRHVSDMRAWFLQKIGRKRAAAFELSNLGVLAPRTDAESTNDYEIQGVLFSQSASACSGALKVSAVTGRDGRISIGFGWQEGIVEDELVSSVKENLEELILFEETTGDSDRAKVIPVP